MAKTAKKAKSKKKASTKGSSKGSSKKKTSSKKKVLKAAEKVAKTQALKKKVVKKANKKTNKKTNKKIAKKTIKKIAKKVLKKTRKKIADKLNKTSKKASSVRKTATKKTATKASARSGQKAVSKKLQKSVAKKKPSTKRTAKPADRKKDETKFDKVITDGVEESVEASKSGKLASELKDGRRSRVKLGETKKKKKKAQKEELVEVPAQKSRYEDDEDFAREADAPIKVRSELEELKENIADELVSLAEDYPLSEIFSAMKTLEYFNKDLDDCVEKGCENPASTLGYCRFHYIKNWQDIKKKQELLKEGKLQIYIQDLVEKFPLKQIESILNDLSDEKSFFEVLKEYRMDDSIEDAIDEIIDEDDGDTDIAYETKETGRPSFDD